MKTIGIDLGTTNSVVASCEHDPRSPRVLANSSGENLTPSVVTARRAPKAEKADILVGRPALNVAKLAPENTILSVKRLMGNDFNEPKLAEAKKRFAYVVEPGPNGDPRAHVRLDGQLASPVEVSAMILTQIRKDASTVLGEDVRHAVITVPAYFEEKQRKATVEAGEKAGLVVKRIIDEPTAAAIAFGIQSRSDKRHTVLVFDLGGGTFDVSLLLLTKGKDGRETFNVLGYDGDRWLGGDDMDRLILEKIIAKVKEYGADPTNDKRFLLDAKAKAEEVKKQLSSQEAVHVVLGAACKGTDGTLIDVEFTLTRAEFDAMIQPLVDRCMACVQRLLSNQNMPSDMISDVLLVGGGTLTPLVRATVEGQFKSRVRRTVNPMECVAMGAAILAATLSGVECGKCSTVNPDEAGRCSKCGEDLATARSAGSIAVHEVTAMNLGIAAVDGDNPDAFVAIIPRGTSYPMSEPRKRLFKATNSRKILVPVFEGDEPLASKNHEQGVVEYDLPQEIDLANLVEVSFNYDRSRTLTVEITVVGSTLLPKRQVLERKRPRTTTSGTPEVAAPDWRAELQQSVDFIGWFVGAYGAYIEPAQKATVESRLQHARTLLNGMGDDESGKRADRELMAAFWGCGVATELHRAARATDGVPREMGEKINDAAAKVRAAYDSGDRHGAAAQAINLRTLIAAAERGRNVEAVGDRRDFGSKLRTVRDGE